MYFLKVFKYVFKIRFYVNVYFNFLGECIRVLVWDWFILFEILKIINLCFSSWDLGVFSLDFVREKEELWMVF